MAVANEAFRTYVLGIPMARPPDLSFLFFPVLLGWGVGAALQRRELCPALGLAFAWAASAPALIVLLSLRRATWKPKFVLVGAPGFELLIALAIAAIVLAAAAFMRRKSPGQEPAFTTFVAGGLCAICLLNLLPPRLETLQANYFDPTHQRDDYRSAIADIVARAGPDDAVLLVAPTQVELFDYYAPPELARYPLPLEREPSPGDVDEEMSAIAGGHRDLYALLYAEREADPEGLVETWLDTHLAKAYDRWHGDLRAALWAKVQPGRLRTTYGSSLRARAWLDDGIGITDFIPPAETLPQGGILVVRLDWASSEPPQANYHVFLQLLDETGALVAQRDDMAPLNGRALTSTWLYGVAHPDRLALALPLDLAPGRYEPILGLYDPQTGRRLPVSVLGNREEGSDAPDLFRRFVSPDEALILDEGDPPDHFVLPPSPSAARRSVTPAPPPAMVPVTPAPRGRRPMPGPRSWIPTLVLALAVGLIAGVLHEPGGARAATECDEPHSRLAGLRGLRGGRPRLARVVRAVTVGRVQRLHRRGRQPASHPPLRRRRDGPQRALVPAHARRGRGRLHRWRADLARLRGREAAGLPAARPRGTVLPHPRAPGTGPRIRPPLPGHRRHEA